MTTDMPTAEQIAEILACLDYSLAVTTTESHKALARHIFDNPGIYADIMDKRGLAKKARAQIKQMALQIKRKRLAEQAQNTPANRYAEGQDQC